MIFLFILIVLFANTCIIFIKKSEDITEKTRMHKNIKQKCCNVNIKEEHILNL